ncbi:disco-interacting protein 2 homolog B-like isoform X2 [Mobula hypostoma]|uniref:disco-interacting protein 2 homolog B-like isoform X2 n=1 Tax=Mobula hypostoma TaxID=723540 RepID=UPI002FC3907F
MSERPLAAGALPREVREQLAELELELSEGDITPKGYEKKRAKLLAPFLAQPTGSDPTPPSDRPPQPAPSRSRRCRSRGSRDERYRSDIHMEAVQAALAKHREQKLALPMPTKRQLVSGKTPAKPATPPDTSSASEDEGSLGTGGLHPVGSQDTATSDHWINQSVQGSSTSSSSASSTLSYSEGRGSSPGGALLGDVAAFPRTENQTAPPDVTSTSGSEGVGSQDQRPPSVHRLSQEPVLDTAAAPSPPPVNSRVSVKIQQLVNTLRRPKRQPLAEFFLDDSQEIVEVPSTDTQQPRAEGSPMTSVRGEPLGAVGNWPPTLEAALQRWGTTQGKAPCLTALDSCGRAGTTLTYGKLWTRSLKLAYTLRHKLGMRSEVTVSPGDRVALVYPNSDPAMFLVAFCGCLLAEVVPVPIEVPLTRRDTADPQLGFLLGSCGVSLALTTEACLKGLPQSQGEVTPSRGWPRLKWVVTDSRYLVKPSKDWRPSFRLAGPEPAYIEYKTSKEGSVMGVCVSRIALLRHCQALTQACNYNEGETVVNVLDFKKDVGLWHGVLTSLINKIHTISVPYAAMKASPLTWVQRVAAHKAKVALVKCRDLHWAMVAQPEHRDFSLSSLRLLIVADGANPWSVSSCDAFLSAFQSRGLRPDAISPCASSPEGLTVAIRRSGQLGCGDRRAVLSLEGLSHGLVRANPEDKSSALTVQDVGPPLPGATLCIVRLQGPPELCRTDEVGEICTSNRVNGCQYYGLPGLTRNTFEVFPINSEGAPISEAPFVRTGLLGFVSPGGLVFVVGKLDGLMMVSGRRHNSDDIVATALAVEPMKTVYRGRVAVFSVTVLYDERVVLVIEQRPDAAEDESFQWMSRVLQAIDSIHQLGVYCLALVPANTLPKTPLGGIHIPQTKQRFLEGALHPCNVLLCPHTCVTNLPKPRQRQPVGVGPAPMMVGNLVAGKRIAEVSGRELVEDLECGRKLQYLSEILQNRAQSTPDDTLFTLLSAKGTPACSVSCLQLHRRAERVSGALTERGRCTAGDVVVLLYPPGIDLIAAFYGCLYTGCVPVTVRPPHPQNLTATLPTVKMIVEVSKAVCVLTTQPICRLLRSREAAAAVDIRSWPQLIETDDLPRRKVPEVYTPPTPEMLAYLDFSVSTTGMLTGVKISHGAVSTLCRSVRLQCELYCSRQIALCLDPYGGFGFALWCLCGVYAGHHTLLIAPAELENNLSLWLSVVSQYRVRDTFCCYAVMERCTRGLGTQTHVLKVRGVNLSCVRTCVVVAEERPRTSLTHSFSKLFKDLGLSPRAVSTTFGSRVNLAICLQGTTGPDPTVVYVDLKALRHDRVRLVERGSPQSLPLIESGKILPGVRVIIVNPETRAPLGDAHLGEIWVNSLHNSSGYYSIEGDDSPRTGHFDARLSFGDTQTSWARTGYLGFVRRTELTVGGGDRHDAVYVVGALDETLELRGLRYHPIDIETSVCRAHRGIGECAVFTWTNLLVVVAELTSSEQEALDLVSLVTGVVLEQHSLIVGVVVVVDPGVVPINSRGEKQRMHLRDSFLADQLDPIYVAYNM